MQRQILKLIYKLSLISLPVLSIVGVYFWLDPFKVIYKYSSYFDSGKYSYVLPNLDFVSTETFITNYPSFKYDSFILGNSRSIFYEVRDWQKYIPSDKCFHFNAYWESIYGIQLKVEFLKKKNIAIKNALIILDYSVFKNTSDFDEALLMKHPTLSGRSQLSFQLEFFKSFCDRKFLKGLLDYKIFHVESNPVGFNIVDYEVKYNEIRNTYIENLIKKDSINYYTTRELSFYPRDTSQRYCEQVIGLKQKEMLQDIFRKLKHDNSNFKVIISPLYDQLKMRKVDVDILIEIFGQENVFDYSGINEITNNQHNFYEKWHYRPHIARLIMKDVYNNKQ